MITANEARKLTEDADNTNRQNDLNLLKTVLQDHIVAACMAGTRSVVFSALVNWNAKPYHFTLKQFRKNIQSICVEAGFEYEEVNEDDIRIRW